jgi:arsenite/tail-anchored protein-transporting ATPase
MTRIILYSGKGGVGKTSLAAATAVRAAHLGRRTLVVSTDSAHSLADALAVPVGGEPTTILPGLDALEIDVNRELASHWGTIQEWLTRFMAFHGVDEAVAEEMAILPGMEELFSLLKVRDFADRKVYDVIIIDCAPTGETVRMLGVPEILGFYFKRVFPLQKTVLKGVRPVARRITDMPLPSDNVLTAVQGIYKQLEGMAPLLQDPESSSIRIVLNPERMVINESQRLYTYLNLFGFPVDAVVANRVLPEEARSRYFDKWFSIQAGHLAEARRSFDPLPFFAAIRRRSSSARSRWRCGRRAPGTPSTSACPSPRRTGSRSGHMPTTWSSRWTISAATSCCRGRWPAGASWAPPSPTSACAWALAGGSTMAAERKGSPSEAGRGRACCLVSEILEEAGLDRSTLRAVRRQVLEGVMLFCQWQLERMERPRPPAGGRGGRKVDVE